MIAATLICGTTVFTACSSGDDDVKDNELTIEKLVGVWVTDYSQSGTKGDLSWNRVVEDYKFDADGTGYYECYRLDGEKYVDASSVRDNDSLHFTINGNTVTITGDENNMVQTLTYADGKLTVQGKTLQKATTEQQTLVDQLYADCSGGNSAPTANITYIERSWDGTQVVDKEAFALAVFSAAAESGRSVRILDRLNQPADHSVNIYHPEGEYLKGLLLYVE